MVTSVITCLLYYVLSGKKLGHIGILVCFYFVSDILMIAAQQVMRGMGKNLYYSFSTYNKSHFGYQYDYYIAWSTWDKEFWIAGCYVIYVNSAFASLFFY